MQPAFDSNNYLTKNSNSNIIVQPCLAIGAVDDMYEQEADAVADKVMRMPKPSLQRKCAHCEEEERIMKKPLTPFIQAKGNESGMEAPASVSKQIESSRGGGNRLDENTKTFMESRFGTDFSGVKIHTDNTAIQMSRNINAQAFTVGNDIYFNSGKYDPNSDGGKHLLAHELTHTIQQGNTVRRLPNPAFSIEGLEETRADEDNFVYFDLNNPDNSITPEASLDADERQKIVDFATNNTTGIQLFGFASEEGESASNTDLINLRLQAVRNVLSAVNYTQPINSQPLLSASNNQFNYRFWRTVEMRRIGETSARIQSPSAMANRGLEACHIDDRNNIIIPARDEAINNLDTAITAINDFISNAAAHTDTDRALRAIFGSSSSRTATQVRDRLQANKNFLSNMMSVLQCGTEHSIDCGDTAEALTNPRSIILCHPFLDSSRTLSGRANTLIHESSHGSRFELHDRAYRSERVMSIINTLQALDNAESIAAFVETIISGAAVNVGPSAPDTATNCGAHEQMVRSAIAWAERWNTYAVFGLQQTYGNTGNTSFMTPHIGFYFGSTSKTVLAGILDRYTQMMNFFDAGPIDIECVDRHDPLYNTWKVAEWNNRTVKISIEQLNASHLNSDDRVKYVYGALATDVIHVPEEHRMAYPNVARAYKLFFWNVWG